MADNTHRGLELGTGLFVLLGFAALAFGLFGGGLGERGVHSHKRAPVGSNGG